MPAKKTKKKSAKKKSTKNKDTYKNRHSEIETLIAAKWDEVEAYSVYGDWLQSQGDPRGDLIGLMIAAESDDTLQPDVAQAIASYESVALAEVVPYVKLSWRRGFVERVAFRVHTRDPVDWGAILTFVLRKPAGVFVRAFAFNFRILKARAAQYQATFKALVSHAPELRDLDLHESCATNLDLSLLGRLAHLERLNLHCTSLESLSGLEHAASLRSLNLETNPRLSTLEPLRGLQRLEYLSLGGAKIRDLSPLAELPALERLQLHWLKVKVRDLDWALQLPRLRYLDLRGTSIDPRIVQKLDKALPHLTIEHYD